MRELALILALTVFGAEGTASEVMASLSDGPHVLWEGRTARVLRVEAGHLVETRLGPPWKLELEGLPALRLDPAGVAPPRAEWPMPVRIAAISDLHGHLDSAVALLKAQGVLSADRRWAFGKGHLVVVGDTMDRGSQVTEALWLLRSLEAQAAAAGGRVHVLMGNHEAMALRGRTTYLHPKYKALALGPLEKEGPALLGPSSELGRWLRQRPALVRLGDLLFCHGGPSLDLARQAPALDAVNAGLREAIFQEGRPFLMSEKGPLWYRGLIPGAADRDATDEEVGAILKAFRVRAVVVGHSTLERLEAFHGGRVYGVDAGLKDSRAGELWLWEGGRARRGLADGSRVDLP